ncbi:MAG TPA: mechanosensitive ion channel domain-containing protein [Candidatus Acidoferrales bacterium]|nr:mechanosensitive ion channel domain-containing protein [Candidatus Acidoferrales bacterium]
MKIAQKGILFLLLALLVAAAAGIVLTRSQVRTVPQQTAARPSQANLVDEEPLQTAQKLAAMAVTASERQFATEALSDGDHEVDMTFAFALRNVAEHPPVLNAEGKALEARIEKRQTRTDAQQAEVTTLTALLSKATGARKVELQQRLQLAQALLSLDQDALADAHEDLSRAGDDPRSAIQQMLEEHEQSEVHKGDEQVGAAANSKEAVVETMTARDIIAQWRAWTSLDAKREVLEAARNAALARAASLARSHSQLEELLTQQQSQKHSASGGAAKSSASTTAPVSAPQSDGSDDIAQELAAVQTQTQEQRTLAEFDHRIEMEQSLAQTYAAWSALVAGLQRNFLHGLLISTFWIVLIAFAVFLSDGLIRHFLMKLGPDRKRLLTLRSIFVVAIRVIGAVAILILIFGMPSQFATVLALAGAGLTVALKDFIVGFLGWFVLMGRNGIRPGDWVEINGVAGEVFEVGLLHTVLLEVGNWSDSGHPTGRKVTFVNSYAIEGQYFNFSTSGQWMWDELQLTVPPGENPYPIGDAILKIVTDATQENTRTAEKEWERVTLAHGSKMFTAKPTLNLQPKSDGTTLTIRYITRANERHELRSRLYRAALDILHGTKIEGAENKGVASKTSPTPV